MLKPMDIETLYLTHFTPMVDMASRYLPREDAEDVVQDVITMLWERREQLTFLNNIASYAYSSVRNRCLDIMKHETYKREYCRRTLQTMARDIMMESMINKSATETEVLYRELEVHVNKAVSMLPTRCRTIFCMSRIEGLQYHEIGEALGISKNTVACQMTIALNKLRKMLQVV